MPNRIAGDEAKRLAALYADVVGQGEVAKLLTDMASEIKLLECMAETEKRVANDLQRRIDQDSATIETLRSERDYYANMCNKYVHKMKANGIDLHEG